MFNEVNEDILNQYAYHIEAKKGALDYIKKCASENKNDGCIDIKHKSII